MKDQEQQAHNDPQDTNKNADNNSSNDLNQNSDEFVQDILFHLKFQGKELLF